MIIISESKSTYCLSRLTFRIVSTLFDDHDHDDQHVLSRTNDDLNGDTFSIFKCNRSIVIVVIFSQANELIEKFNEDMRSIDQA
jgi:hypothetical protein